MSVFRLSANINYPIDSRYIQSCDLVIQNMGERDFEVLVQANNETSVFYTSLHYVGVPTSLSSTLTILNIGTYQSPFSLLIVTNLLYTHTTVITLYAKNNGNLIAIFTQNDFMKIE